MNQASRQILSAFWLRKWNYIQLLEGFNEFILGPHVDRNNLLKIHKMWPIILMINLIPCHCAPSVIITSSIYYICQSISYVETWNTSVKTLLHGLFALYFWYGPYDIPEILYTDCNLNHILNRLLNWLLIKVNLPRL